MRAPVRSTSSIPSRTNRINPLTMALRTWRPFHWKLFVAAAGHENETGPHAVGWDSGRGSRVYLFGARSPYWKLPGSVSRGYECDHPFRDEYVGENCVLFALRRGHSHFAGGSGGGDPSCAVLWARRPQKECCRLRPDLGARRADRAPGA